MRDETVARNYAETLFDLALRHEGVEVYQGHLDTVSRLLDQNPEARRFLETPRIGAEAKKEVLRKAFAHRVPGPFLNFLLVTVDKRRQRLLRSMASEYDELVDRHLNRTHIRITAARPLVDEAVDEIAEAFSRLLEMEAVPHVRVDPSILGGVVVRTGDTIYDGSLRRRVEGMRRGLMAADLPEAGELGLKETN